MFGSANDYRQRCSGRDSPYTKMDIITEGISPHIKNERTFVNKHRSKKTNTHELAPLQDASYLVRRIGEVTKLTREQVVDRLRAESRQLGLNVRKAFESRGLTRYQWSEEMSEFYDDTDAFLFETVIWNRTVTKQAIRSWVETFLTQTLPKKAKILTFGDGLGFDSLYLALAGHQVDYFEVSQRGIQFAKGLFKDYQGDVNVLTSSDQVLPGQYDAVVCLDVLEHIPEPSNIVAFLAGALREEGYFLVHAPFWFLSPAVVTHLRENRRFSGDVRRLYRPHGLHAVDSALFWNPIALQKRTDGPPPRLSIGHRAQLFFGASVLWWGRFWSTPYVPFASLMTKPSDWPDLDTV